MAFRFLICQKTTPTTGIDIFDFAGETYHVVGAGVDKVKMLALLPVNFRLAQVEFFDSNEVSSLNKYKFICWIT